MWSKDGVTRSYLLINFFIFFYYYYYYYLFFFFKKKPNCQTTFDEHQGVAKWKL
jgi:hypothetical protein